MKDVYKKYLFNHGILVSENKVALDEAFASRVILENSFGIRINNGKNLICTEIVPFVADMLGKNVPEPFYKGFPESVRTLSEDELLFDQLLHYIRTYGFGDFAEPGYSCLEEYIEKKAFDEKTDAKLFDVVTCSEAQDKLAEYCESLLKITRPLNSEQYNFICEYIRDFNYKVTNCASKNLAIKLLLEFRDTRYAYFIKMSDVIKLVDEMNYKIYNNENIKKLNFKNSDRKFLTKVINELFHADFCDLSTCYEKKAIWNGLLHHIHYQPIDEISAGFVQAMRDKSNHSVYSEFEHALALSDINAAVKALKEGKGSGAILRNLNYIISRCKSDDEIELVTNAISSSNGIVLLQLLLEYASYEQNNNGRTFTFTKHNKFVTHEESEAEQEKRKSIIDQKNIVRLCNSIKSATLEYYKDKLGRVYIDEAMKNIALPLQENTGVGGYGVLSKGSKIHLEEGKIIRAFTYWEKVDDIDLSVIGIKDDGKQKEFSWRTMFRNQSEAITYSGDETAGYNGGSEYFDLDVEKFKKLYPDIRYLVFCDNVFSSSTFTKCICRAGYMLRDRHSSGEIYEPKTVKSAFEVKGDSTFAYLFALDLEKSDFIWLNIMKDGFNHVAGATKLDFLKKYFNAVDVINLYDLFGMMATEIVSDPDSADVIVSDAELTEIKGKEIIRSYDFERIIELMNF
jgi:hypothetical protein